MPTIVQLIACFGTLAIVWPLPWWQQIAVFVAMIAYAEALKAKCGIGLYRHSGDL